MKSKKEQPDRPVQPLMVSLKTLAAKVDARRSTVRRWLDEAGVQPIAVGNGRRGAIRYRWTEVEMWLKSLQKVE